MKINLLFLTAVLQASALFSQTNVSGGIYNNTTWAKANSPYIVTGNIVLFPDKILTIEPGVEVKFNGYFNIEIRGKLVAIGNINDSIKFASNVSQAKSAWDRIKILNATQNASGFFEYCTLKHSFYGISVECCWGNDSSYVKHSYFENNSFPFTSYSGWDLAIDSCTFINNTIGVGSSGGSDGDKFITNCFFENNGTAIDAGQIRVVNCIIQNNGIGITHIGGWGFNIRIYDCLITNNNIGIDMSGDTIMNNIVSDNTIGIKTGQESYTSNGIQYYVPIKDNEICNNTNYNVENTGAYNKNITQNCFCLDDSAAIEAKLKDGYDDISLGLFNYDIYDTTCQIVIQTVYKIGSPPSSVNSITENNLFTVFPNPVVEDLTIVFNNRIKTPTEISMYNSVGERIISEINTQNGILNVNFNNFPNGLYLLEINNSGIVKKEKIIKI